MDRMRRFFLLPLLFMACSWLAGCATGPRTVEISQQQLQAALERRFPYDLRPGGLLLLNVGVPQLTLLPQTNRLRLDFPLATSERIAPGGAGGSLALSFGLRYQASDATLRATNVAVEQVELRGLPPELRVFLQAAGSMVASFALDDLVLHALRPQDLERAEGWTPGEIRVTPRGVQVQLLPPVAWAGELAIG